MERRRNAATERDWFQQFGRIVRDARMMLGLTQQALAALAQVSQPSISRLEREAGAWTPLATVERVRAVLDRELGPTARARLGCDAAQFLDGGHDLTSRPAPGVTTIPDPLVADTLVDALVRIALRVDHRRRPAFLGVVEAAAVALERPMPRPEPPGEREP